MPQVRLRAWIADGAVVAVLAAAPSIVEGALGQIHAASDLGYMFLPNWSWWRAGGGAESGWNPWIFAGYPADADPLLSRLHPLSLLYAFAAPETVARVEGAVLSVMAALGMLGYLGHAGASRMARVLGAVSFALGGFSAAHAVHPLILRSTAMLPWLLWAIDALDGPLLTLAVGAGVALVVTGGHPQTVLFVLAPVAAYALWFGRVHRARRVFWLAGGALLGLGITADVWLSAWRLIAESTRADVTPPWPNPRLLPQDFRHVIAPFAARWQADSPLACGRLECGAYPGVLAWLVLFATLPWLVADGRMRFWLVLAVVGLAGATGVVALPTGMRHPARFVLWWNVAMAVILARGVDVLDARPSRMRAVVAAVVATALVLAIALWFGPVPVAALSVPVLTLAAGAAVLLAPPAAAARTLGALALLAGELLAYATLIVPAGAPPDHIAALRRPLDAIAPHVPQGSRALFVPLEMGANWAPHARVPLVQGYNLLVPRVLPALLGQRVAIAFESIGDVSDATLAGDTSHVLDLLRVGVVVRRPDHPNPLGTAIARAADAPGGRWRRAAAADLAGRETYVNARVRPLAWLVGKTRVTTAPEGVAILRGQSVGPPFDPGHEALVTRPITVGDRNAATTPLPSVEVVTFTGNRLVVRSAAATDALLVTTELAFPGWVAALDGRQVPIEVVNGAFRGVVVPAGSHEIAFTYAPPVTPRIIGAASLLALCVVGGLGLFGRRGWFRTGTGADGVVAGGSLREPVHR